MKRALTFLFCSIVTVSILLPSVPANAAAGTVYGRFLAPVENPDVDVSTNDGISYYGINHYSLNQVAIEPLYNNRGYRPIFDLSMDNMPSSGNISIRVDNMDGSFSLYLPSSSVWTDKSAFTLSLVTVSGSVLRHYDMVYIKLQTGQYNAKGIVPGLNAFPYTINIPNIEFVDRIFIGFLFNYIEVNGVTDFLFQQTISASFAGEVDMPDPLPPIISGGNGEIVYVDVPVVIQRGLVWNHIVNAVYTDLVRNEQYQYKNYKYYCVTSYLDINSFSSYYLVTLSDAPFVKSVKQHRNDESGVPPVWAVEEVNNNVSNVSWIVKYNPAWSGLVYQVAGAATNALLGWGAPAFYDRFSGNPGESFTDVYGNTVQLVPSVNVFGATLEQPNQTFYDCYINSNYSISTDDWEEMTPFEERMQINDSNQFAASWYLLWRAANSLPITINEEDGSSEEAEALAEQFSSAADALDTIPSELPDVSQLDNQVGDTVQALTPLLSMFVLPILGFAALAWLLRKHD